MLAPASITLGQISMSTAGLSAGRTPFLRLFLCAGGGGGSGDGGDLAAPMPLRGGPLTAISINHILPRRGNSSDTIMLFQ